MRRTPQKTASQARIATLQTGSGWRGYLALLTILTLAMSLAPTACLVVSMIRALPDFRLLLDPVRPPSSQAQLNSL
jgi:hypothetical protein